MIVQSKTLVKFIKNKYIEFSESLIEELQWGWSNHVLLVDKRFIFRFPRSEQDKESLKLEQLVLPLLKNRVSLSIPDFKYASKPEDDITYVGYPIINGSPLLANQLQSLESSKRMEVARNLGTFLTALHTFPTEDLARHFRPKKIYWANFYQRIEKVVFPYINSEQQKWIYQLFDNFLSNNNHFLFKPSLIHGDLKSEHILYDKRNRKLSGIIDFGAMEVGDPAYDFVGIYLNYGEGFAKDVLQFYHVNKDKTFFDRIQKFYTKSIFFYGFIYAIETNNDEAVQARIKKLNSNMRKN